MYGMLYRITRAASSEQEYWQLITYRSFRRPEKMQRVYSPHIASSTTHHALLDAAAAVAASSVAPWRRSTISPAVSDVSPYFKCSVAFCQLENKRICYVMFVLRLVQESVLSER